MVITAFSSGLILICILFVSYPLFFKRLQILQLPEKEQENFNEQESLLSSLSDLEDEYLLGKWSRRDYQRQKLHFQRMYIKLKKDSDGKFSGAS